MLILKKSKGKRLLRRQSLLYTTKQLIIISTPRFIQTKILPKVNRRIKILKDSQDLSKLYNNNGRNKMTPLYQSRGSPLSKYLILIKPPVSSFHLQAFHPLSSLSLLRYPCPSSFKEVHPWIIRTSLTCNSETLSSNSSSSSSKCNKLRYSREWVRAPSSRAIIEGWFPSSRYLPLLHRIWEVWQLRRRQAHSTRTHSQMSRS